MTNNRTWVGEIIGFLSLDHRSKDQKISHPYIMEKSENHPQILDFKLGGVNARDLGLSTLEDGGYISWLKGDVKSL